MNILTEKEREDVYKYWLNSSTLTNEDGLIQLAERAVLEKLEWMARQRALCRDDTEHGKDYCTAAQLHQAYAQGAASVLNAEPVACIVEASDGANMVWPIADLDEARTYCADDEEPVPLYTLKTIK